MNSLLKVLLVCALFFLNICAAETVKAQQDHFIYIQADNNEAFSVAVNGKTFSSSDPGYVIIPKLTTGNYTLLVSFLNNKFPDQKFYCSIDKNDIGFALKNYQDKGWGLFNLQTFDIKMAGDTSIALVDKHNTNTTTNTNAFGDMLSQVVNDSTLNKPIEIEHKPEVKKQETINDSLLAQMKENPLTKDTVAAVADNNTTSIVDSTASTTVEPVADTAATTKEIMQQPAEQTAKTTVEKISEASTTNGIEQVFVDKNSGDTIRITMPAISAPDSAIVVADTIKKEPEKIQDTATTIVKQEAIPVADTTIVKPVENTTVNNSSNTTDPKNPFFNKEQSQPNANQDSNATVTETTDNTSQNTGGTSASGYLYKSDCKYVLTEGDMDKIRKKMISASSDEKMIQVVQKYTQTNCITTEQVKSLSALFFTDEGRYNFFDAIYKSVYDITQFATLQSQLIDPYYKKRFQAMLK